MWKTATLTLAITGLVAVAPAHAQTDDAQFAYIDSQRIIAETPGAQEARETIQQEMASFQQELDQLEAEIKTLMDEYDQKQVMLSPEAKRAEQQEILTKQQEYQRRAAELQQQAAQRQAELFQPIMQRINSVISDIRREEGYAMVFDVAGGVLVAADPGLDITDQVIARLRADTTAVGQP